MYGRLLTAVDGVAGSDGTKAGNDYIMNDLIEWQPLISSIAHIPVRCQSARLVQRRHLDLI